ncbi:unnamed protein product [Brassicogethes aeneus]|uniref:Uncharacterized protein n=1 Tax=Brassicogethes aeneus TaxID=1431903 RepID=A0A9P0FFJ0_BRAAE|nr:unnamed protein product [Brassicogethes aeneus]
MLKHSILVLACVAQVFASPLPKEPKDNEGKVLYDQRQEGEWNVRADLQNFVIMIIPTQTSSPSPVGSEVGLLDFLSKSIPKRNHLKRFKVKAPAAMQSQDVSPDTMHFIESKSAPYHVDISKTKTELSKLHPQKRSEELVANSPSLRLSRAVVFSVPDEEFVVTRTEDHKKVVKKDGKKKIIKEKPTLMLIGEGIEQCGPGRERDEQGICKSSKQ